jgi:hypothetical protein
MWNPFSYMLARGEKQGKPGQRRTKALIRIKTQSVSVWIVLYWRKSPDTARNRIFILDRRQLISTRRQAKRKAETITTDQSQQKRNRCQRMILYFSNSTRWIIIKAINMFHHLNRRVKDIISYLSSRWLLEWISKKLVSIREIGLIRLRTGIIGESLWMRHWTSEFYKSWS